MARFDRLRVSLLTAIAACGPKPSDDGGSSDTEGETSMPDMSDSTETDSTETETGDDTDGCGTCESPEVIADGLVMCADGSINRVAPGTYDPTIGGQACLGDEQMMLCSSDADCMAGSHGACRRYSIEVETETYSVCGCLYACASDEDCGPGQACVPPGVVEGTPTYPSCVQASCTSNEGCMCGECGLSPGVGGCEGPTFGCRLADDTCRTSVDCDPLEFSIPVCKESPTGWSCEEGDCGTPGRPLLVDARARLAPARRRDDWGVAIALLPDAALARYWARIAALEHASVASFARFAIQLLTLGAPPELVRQTQQAALDEVRHAQLAYGLASAYGGAPVGPGQLELGGVAVRCSWREVVAALIEEACVNETLSTAEALAALDSTTVPEVREVLAIIVADEQRHAQLAWRCLAWLLDAAEPADRRWALALLQHMIASLRVRAGGLDRPAHGVLGGVRRAAVHRQAIAEVLVPVARALAA